MPRRRPWLGTRSDRRAGVDQQSDGIALSRQSFGSDRAVRRRSPPPARGRGDAATGPPADLIDLGGRERACAALLSEAGSTPDPTDQGEKRGGRPPPYRNRTPRHRPSTTVPQRRRRPYVNGRAPTGVLIRRRIRPSAYGPRALGAVPPGRSTARMASGLPHSYQSL